MSDHVVWVVMEENHNGAEVLAIFSTEATANAYAAYRATINDIHDGFENEYRVYAHKVQS